MGPSAQICVRRRRRSPGDRALRLRLKGLLLRKEQKEDRAVGACAGAEVSASLAGKDGS